MTVEFRSRFKLVGAISALLAVAGFCACDPAVKPSEEKPLSWEQVVAGLNEPVGSVGYTSAMISLSQTWKDHGQEGAVLMTTRGLELVGLSANKAIGDVSYMLGTKSFEGGAKYQGQLVASLADASKAAPEGWFQTVVSLASLMGIGGQKDVQALVDMADAGDHELAESARLCLAAHLADALIAASSSLPGERGRVILQRLPGWPSPPTRVIMETLFPANLSRISKWISDGLKKGGLHEKAWTNVAARMTAGLNGRMFDVPVVVNSDARAGTPISAISGKYQPLEVAHITASGVLMGLRPVLEWKDSFVTVASGDATWPVRPTVEKQEGQEAGGTIAGDAPSSLPERAAALRTLADRLEKAVYPQFIGAGILSSERLRRSVLLAVEPDAQAELVARSVSALAEAGYSDFRFLTPGPVGSMNPLLAAGNVGELSTDRSVQAFLTGKGVSMFAKPYGPLTVTEPPVGAEAIKKGNKIGGLFVPWDAARGFSGNVTMAFANMAPAAAGTVETAEVFVMPGDVPAAMMVDVVSELQAAPGVKFSILEPFFPGLICPQGRACPGVVPVLGGSARAPLPVR